MMINCVCERCQDERNEGKLFIEKMFVMSVCSDCGNKRCPKATDHDLDCTNSNEPGQKGSSWEDYPQFTDDITLHGPEEPQYVQLMNRGEVIWKGTMEEYGLALGMMMELATETLYIKEASSASDADHVCNDMADCYRLVKRWPIEGFEPNAWMNQDGYNGE